MPTTSEKIITPPIKKLGIIAGGGVLPQRLLAVCEEQNIEPFLVGFEGQTDPSLFAGQNYMWTRLGAAGQILNTLKSHDIKDLVFIGSIRRPSLSELRPDLKTAEFFAKIAVKSIGDHDLFCVLREILEKEGFVIHGAHKFARDLLTPKGALGKYKPKKLDLIDIERGINISQILGGLDVGQSVIVQEGIVLGVEAAEGTDELIARCKHLQRKGRGGILIKTCKPQQDPDFDLPTIGPETIIKAAASGLCGVAVHAEKSLLIDPQEVALLANKHKIFVIGIDVNRADTKRDIL